MAKTPKTASKQTLEKSEKGQRFTRELRIKGIFLRVRAIVEQGRVDEFFEACEKAGFTKLKGLPGIVEFTNTFISEGLPEQAHEEAAVDPKTYRFTKAVMGVSPIDC